MEDYQIGDQVVWQERRDDINWRRARRAFGEGPFIVIGINHQIVFGGTALVPGIVELTWLTLGTCPDAEGQFELKQQPRKALMQPGLAIPAKFQADWFRLFMRPQV